MGCPYLAEVTMLFCQAAPIKKLIPSDRVSTASPCDAGEYRECPLYREAMARAGRAIAEQENESTHELEKGERS